MSVNRKILIIGGTGLVGKRLTKLLLTQGHHLTLLSRGNLKDDFGDKVDRILCDRNHTDALSKAVAGKQWDIIYDQVCHNVKQAEQACNIFKDKTDRYIFSSSQVVYGLGKNLKEKAFDPTCFNIMGVATGYARAIQQAEAYMYSNAPWPVVAVRFPIIFGQNDPWLGFHIARMLSGQEIYFPSQDFNLSLIDADSAAQSLAFFLDLALNEPINCAPNNPISIRDLISVLEKSLNVPMRMAVIESAKSTSPYALTTDWTLSVERLTELGLILPPIQERLEETLLSCDKSVAMSGLLKKLGLPIAYKIIPPEIQGKKVVITGSSDGFGQSLAFNLAYFGAHVVIHGNNADSVENTVKVIQNSGYQAISVVSDLGTIEGCNKLIDDVLQKFNGIDILINNAAISSSVSEPFWEADPSEWDKLIDVNLSAPLHCSARLTRWVKSQPKNKITIKIINVLDRSTFVSFHKLPQYRITKQALKALTETMAAQTDGSNICVIGIERGYAETNIGKNVNGTQPGINIQLHPDSLTPIFSYVLESPPEHLHGKMFSSPHYNHDHDAGIRMNPAWVYNVPYRLLDRYHPNGDEVDRRLAKNSMFDRGETPLGASPKALKALKNIDTLDLTRYPARCDYYQLRCALGEYYHLSEACFAIGPGSNELIERILRCFTDVGSKVLSNEPTYYMFEHSCQGLKLINLQADLKKTEQGIDHNLEGIASMIDNSVRLIYLISPANPIGVSIKESEFLRFLEKVPKHIPIIVDEAYIEYSSAPDILKTYKLLTKVEHCLIGIRTFSKAYGLAGLRIGYVYSKPDTIALLERLEPLASVNALSEIVAIAALGDDEHLHRVRQLLDKDRSRIESRLKAAGIDFISVDVPYLPVKLPFDHHQLILRLEESNIYISPILYFKDYIRIPLGDPKVSNLIVDTILSMLKSV